MHELRRLVPRQFADWGGTCVIDSDPDGLWRDCRVIDISSSGAGLELVDAPLETLGHRILVAVHLQAEIRNAAPTKGGHLRVGAQFVNPTRAERSYLESQERLAVHW